MHNKNTIEGLRKTISTILSTKYGVAFFKWFELECGYNASNIVLDSNGRVNTDATIINEALRRFYLNVRGFMSKEAQLEIMDFDLTKFFNTIVQEEDK